VQRLDRSGSLRYFLKGLIELGQILDFDHDMKLAERTGAESGS
jgi:hypothetical protein